MNKILFLLKNQNSFFNKPKKFFKNRVQNKKGVLNTRNEPKN
jgi:hypothetical protein